MIDEDLISEATKRYPKGTKVQFGEGAGIQISNGTFRIFWDQLDGTCVVDDSGENCFYVEKEDGVPRPEWASVIGFESNLQKVDSETINNGRSEAYKRIIE